MSLLVQLKGLNSFDYCKIKFLTNLSWFVKIESVKLIYIVFEVLKRRFSYTDINRFRNRNILHGFKLITLY